MLVEALKSKGVVQVACGSGHTVVLSGKRYLPICFVLLFLLRGYFVEKAKEKGGGGGGGSGR